MKLTQLGPYRLGKPIGKGGMGAVYEATDIQTGQQVAVKALNPQLAQVEGFRERFEAEIASLKTLRHEGIVRLFGFGEQDGVLFYSMEMVHGTSLEDEIKAGRRFNWREVTDIAIQLCRALKHAHDHGVIHRDIKPANILISAEERVKLADFGIARLFGSYSGLTSAGGVLGTADYMSPEQADGRPVSHRCDQYSLGGVMYALLAGRPPFRAKSLPEMLQLQRFAQPEPVSRYARDTPAQLEGVIMQLLSKDPADRFPNVQVLARHLQAMERALSRPLLESEAADSLGGEPDLMGDAIDPSLPLAATQPDVELSSVGEALPGDKTAADVAGSDDSETMYEAPAAAAAAVRAARAGDAADTAAEEPTTIPVGPSVFTTVEEDAARSQEPSRPWLAMLAPLAGLILLAGALIGMGMYLTRPLTADELYAKISTQADSEDSASLREVGREIDEFLARFPDDDRADELRDYQEQIGLDRAHRRLQFQVRRGNSADVELLPVESLYLEAMNTAATSPEMAAEKLASLIALYGNGLSRENQASTYDTNAAESDSNGELDEQQRRDQCVHLAERQLATLREEIAKQRQLELTALRERLKVAAELETSDLAAAAEMYRAIVDLYGQRDWAADVVSEARGRLDQLSSSASSEPRTNRMD